MVLPALQYCRDELSLTERGDLVHRENNHVVRPSAFAMQLWGEMKAEFCKIDVHDLWLVACFRSPDLRDFEFWEDPAERQMYKLRGETLTRVLYEKEVINTQESPMINL